MAAEAAPDLAAAAQSVPFEALVAIGRRKLLTDRGQPTAAADSAIARLAARIEASDSLSREEPLRNFARLAASLNEGSGGRSEQVWEQITTLMPALMRSAAAPVVESRLARFDAAAARFRSVDLDLESFAAEAGLDPEIATRLRAIVPAREASAGSATDRRRDDENEGWELRALSGTLTPEEALRLARLQPESDARTREQHRRSLADGGFKAVAALLFVLAIRKAAQQVELSTGITAGRVDALEETNRAIENVRTAMKASGWEVPEMPAEAGPELPETARARRSSGHER